MASENFKRDQNHIPVNAGVGNDSDLETIMLRIDPTTKRLLVESLVQQDGYDSVVDGTKTVATAGTAVQLDNVTCKRVIVQAHEENIGTLVIGGSTVVAALSGRRGQALLPFQSCAFYVSNLNLLYIDSTVSGDKIHYYVEN